MNNYLLQSIKLFLSYVNYSFEDKFHNIIYSELEKILNIKSKIEINNTLQITYNELQQKLSKINEKTIKQKKQGIYYTDSDVIEYIYNKSLELLSADSINLIDFTVFDPTCGTGEFLLYVLQQKLNQKNKYSVSKIVSTIFGNDINKDSINITKIRIFALLLQNCSINEIDGISNYLNKQFTNKDFINCDDFNKKYDLIIGNPPYVENSKSEIKSTENFGNIYANVLFNSSKLLNQNGVLGFIIPISFSSTPRMQKIRNELSNNLKLQYISSFADRPDCLFSSVHQKLNIFIAKRTDSNSKVFTSNYLYWYKQERAKLFDSINYVENTFYNEKFIPKLGNEKDLIIFNKIAKNSVSLQTALSYNSSPLWLNMRATFWIKCFSKEHNGGEYKKFLCENSNIRDFCLALLNSSLFWWFWTVVSDCWHITNKDLMAFKIPEKIEENVISELVINLEKKLEDTKKYIGSKQVEYEYKHKLCMTEIHEIDDYICNVYGLTKDETEYIKNFAIQYRLSLGCNEKSAFKTIV